MFHIDKICRQCTALDCHLDHISRSPRSAFNTNGFHIFQEDTIRDSDIIPFSISLEYRAAEFPAKQIPRQWLDSKIDRLSPDVQFFLHASKWTPPHETNIHYINTLYWANRIIISAAFHKNIYFFGRILCAEIGLENFRALSISRDEYKFFGWPLKTRRYVWKINTAFIRLTFTTFKLWTWTVISFLLFCLLFD